MSVTYQKPELAKKREDYRKEVTARLFPNRGDITDVVATGVSSRATVKRWKDENYSLPDAFELKLIAESRQESPIWLAFGVGPRNPNVLNAALEIATNLEKDTILTNLLNAYKKTRPSARLILSQLANELATVEPIPAPVAAPGESAPLSQTLAELDSIREELLQVTRKMLGEDPLRPSFSAVATRLDRLAEALSPESSQPSTAPAAAAAEVETVHVANSKLPQQPVRRIVRASS